MRDSWGQNLWTKDGRQVALRAAHEVQRRGHSGQTSGQLQPRGARTDENIDQVNDMVLSQ